MPYTLTVFSSQPLQVEKLSEADADRRRLALMQARLQDVNNLVKIKNPSLLLQLQKNPSLSAAGGNQGRGGK